MEKTILEQWREKAYDAGADSGAMKRLWTDYFEKEKNIYRQLLENINNPAIEGTVRELSEKFGVMKRKIGSS